MKRHAHSRLLGFAVVLAFTLSTSRLDGQGTAEPRTFSGTVYYAGGNKPAEGVTVELHTNEGSLMVSQITSGNGWFEFRGLPRGVYAVAIHMSAFDPVDFGVDLTLSSSRGSVIYLRSRQNNAPPSGASSVSAHELSMPQKARNLMESGKRKLYIDKDGRGGLADFQQAVSIAPDYYEASYQVAMAYLALGNEDSAQKSLRQAIEVSGDKYGEADIGLGTTMLDKGDFAAGEKTIRRGIELSPKLWLGPYELGRALLDQDRIGDAEKAAVEARTLAPNAPLVYRLLCNVHLREQNYSASLADIDAYLKLDPDSPAGIRAKQLRQQIQQKTDAGGLPNPP
jgi:Carboxypeptidase regulatory-like domain/Tetratricopeptide repeat